MLSAHHGCVALCCTQYFTDLQIFLIVSRFGYNYLLNAVNAKFTELCIYSI